MNFRDYLSLAKTLAKGAAEAEWRSACSRAYYAAFHVARVLMEDLGFTVPHADSAHGYLLHRLGNSGHTDVVHAASSLNQLKGLRNTADYNDQRAVSKRDAFHAVQIAEDIIQDLDAAALEPVRTQITDTMKIYERNILHQVTWTP